MEGQKVYFSYLGGRVPFSIKKTLFKKKILTILSAQVPTIGATLSGWFAKGRPQNCPTLNPDHVGVGIMSKSRNI